MKLNPPTFYPFEMEVREDHKVVFLYLVNSEQEIEKIRFERVFYNGEYYEVRDGKNTFQSFSKHYAAYRDYALVLDGQYTLRALDEMFTLRTEHFNDCIEVGRKLYLKSKDDRGKFFVNFDKYLDKIDFR